MITHARGAVFLLLLSVLPAACSDATGIRSHTLSIMDGTISVAPGEYAYYQVDVTWDMRSPHVVGWFAAQGGSGNDIKAYVMSASEFVNFSNGYSAYPEYSSGQVTTASFDVPLPIGTYYAVYDNTFSVVSTKSVDMQLELDWHE